MTMRPVRRSGPRRRRTPAGPTGPGSPSTRRPGVRMLPARHIRSGPTTTGSSSVVMVRLGSALDTTTRAWSSSPFARRRPIARCSFVSTSTTSAPVRISAPSDLAAEARASASAPGPPRANVDCPAAPPSFPAESPRNTAVVPADHGPIAVYCTARDATAPRTARSRRTPPRSRRWPWAWPGWPRATPFGPGAGRRCRSGPRSWRRRTRALHVGRGRGVQVGQEAGQGSDPRSKRGYASASCGRARAQLLGGPRGIGPQRERRAVRLRREHAHRRIDEREAVPLQPEVLDHRPPQPPDRVRDARRPDAGRDLVGRRGCRPPSRGAPAPATAAAGLRQVRRGHQAVVAGADDDRVVGRRAASRGPPPAGPPRLQDLERRDPARARP